MSHSVLNTTPQRASLSSPVSSSGAPCGDLLTPRKPLLSEVVKMICADARHDSLKYAIRSNVGQDGE